MKPVWPIVSFAMVTCLLLAAAPGSAQSEDVDDFADLAGLVVADASNQGTLYTTPAEEGDVLTALDAIPIGGGLYELDLEGELVQVSVSLTPLPALYLTSGDVNPKPKEGKVFRNAQCVLSTPGITSPCSGYNYQWTIFQTQPIHRCKRPGNGFCVEKKKVAWTRFIFSDSACKNMIALQSKKKYSCQ